MIFHLTDQPEPPSGAHRQGLTIMEMLVSISLLAVVFHFVSVLLIFIALLGIQSARSAFRNARNPYYTSVSPQARLALFGAWLGLVLYLGVMTLQSESLFVSLAR